MKAYFNKIFSPGQYRFSEKQITQYCHSNNLEILDFNAKAGTLIFADTKGIHRGKPIEHGRRYVLFCYYWDKNVPSFFEKYKQNKI